MMHLLSAKITIARSIYNIERTFEKTRMQALKSALLAFVPL